MEQIEYMRRNKKSKSSNIEKKEQIFKYFNYYRQSICAGINYLLLLLLLLLLSNTPGKNPSHQRKEPVAAENRGRYLGTRKGGRASLEQGRVETSLSRVQRVEGKSLETRGMWQGPNTKGQDEAKRETRQRARKGMVGQYQSGLDKEKAKRQVVNGKSQRVWIKFIRQILFKSKVLVKILEILVPKLFKIPIKIHS